AWMAVEGAVGLNMAGRGATLVLRTSWFNCSSWICAKEIAAIRVYGCHAFTSRISGFRPSIKVSGMRILEKGVAGWKYMKKKDLNITNLEAYTMASEEAIDTKLEAFGNRMEEKMRSLFVEFSIGRLSNSRKSQHEETSNR
ncbi:hypothetical protein GW17_00061574, partial [Ensete ventricosum]